jgi:hypothetical protein
MSDSPVILRTYFIHVSQKGEVTLTTGAADKFIGVYSGRLPHPNEREGAVDGSPGPVERAGNENKCGKDNEPDANKHEDVHVTSTPGDWL